MINCKIIEEPCDGGWLSNKVSWPVLTWYNGCGWSIPLINKLMYETSSGDNMWVVPYWASPSESVYVSFSPSEKV